MKTTQIEVHDPNCRGVTSADGRQRFDANSKGVITVPEHEAKRLIQTPLASRYHRGFSLGTVELGLQRQYELWRDAHPERGHVPYATWYREQKEGQPCTPNIRT